MPNERYIPTLEDIARVCAEIREGWSKERWDRQRVRAERGWMPPMSSRKPGHEQDSRDD